MMVFFNELSAKESPHVDGARRLMKDFMLLYKKAASAGFTDLKTTENLMGNYIAPEYTLAKWMEDNEVDQEMRLLFKSVALRSPFVQELILVYEDLEATEFSLEGTPVLAFAAGLAYDGLVMSLDNDDRWNNHSVTITVKRLRMDSTILESRKPVAHISRDAHVDSLSDWFLAKKRASVPNGKILWLRRHDLFPHLLISPRVRRFVESLGQDEPLFGQIINRIFELENYFADWHDGPFDCEAIPSKATPESPSRLAAYRDALTILCSDGIAREFTWHLRYTPNAGRIYFHPDSDSRKCHIGYIGPKIGA
jgi:hypothetical protein